MEPVHGTLFGGVEGYLLNLESDRQAHECSSNQIRRARIEQERGLLHLSDEHREVAVHGFPQHSGKSRCRPQHGPYLTPISI